MLFMVSDWIQDFGAEPMHAYHPQRTADLGAGTGNLSRALPLGAVCVEKDKLRYRAGECKAQGTGVDPFYFYF